MPSGSCLLGLCVPGTGSSHLPAKDSSTAAAKGAGRLGLQGVSRTRALLTARASRGTLLPPHAPVQPYSLGAAPPPGCREQTVLRLLPARHRGLPGPGQVSVNKTRSSLRAQPLGTGRKTPSGKWWSRSWKLSLGPIDLAHRASSSTTQEAIPMGEWHV